MDIGGALVDFRFLKMSLLLMLLLLDSLCCHCSERKWTMLQFNPWLATINFDGYYIIVSRFPESNGREFKRITIDYCSSSKREI